MTFQSLLLVNVSTVKKVLFVCGAQKHVNTHWTLIPKAVEKRPLHRQSTRKCTTKCVIYLKDQALNVLKKIGEEANPYLAYLTVQKLPAVQDGVKLNCVVTTRRADDDSDSRWSLQTKTQRQDNEHR